jgi:regulatory protein
LLTIQINDIRRAALDFLARREHSTTELLHKLSKKKFEENQIHPVLAALSQEGLLSDSRFTEAFVHYRRRMGYGPLYIQAELKNRGITEDIIQQHLQPSTEIWLNTIHDVWKKKFKSALPSDYKTQAKQMRFLQYRGFTQKQINSLFRGDD